MISSFKIDNDKADGRDGFIVHCIQTSVFPRNCSFEQRTGTNDDITNDFSFFVFATTSIPVKFQRSKEKLFLLFLLFVRFQIVHFTFVGVLRVGQTQKKRKHSRLVCDSIKYISAAISHLVGIDFFLLGQFFRFFLFLLFLLR